MRLQFTMEGQGDPVVMLHSGGMSGRQWKRLGQLLSSQYQVVLPDLIGCGANPPFAGGPFEFQEDVDAVADLLAPLENYHLVGHSYGGLLAMTLARLQPERVLSVSVYDPVTWGAILEDPEGMADLMRVGSNPVFLDDSRGGSADWWEVFMDYWNGPGTWKTLSEPAQAGFLQVGPKVYAEVRSLVNNKVPGEAYRCVTAPALLLTGEHTPTAARRVVSLLREILPDASLVEIPDAGHMGPITHADLVNAKIREHILGVRTLA